MSTLGQVITARRIFGGRTSVLARVALLCLIVGMLYLVVFPLVRLQATALSDHADGYREALHRARLTRILLTTAALAVGSLVIALVLGTLLAWSATRLPRRLRVLRVLPVLPIVVPSVASVVGWVFLLSPRPGYLNAALRNLPWWSGRTEGPIDIYTVQWIIILTGFSLSSFVYLFVSAGFENINTEHIEAARIAGSSNLGVFIRVTLPLLRPTLVYGGGVALLLGLGQFTAPLLLGRTNGVDVLTTVIYQEMAQLPVRYTVASAFGTPLLLFGIGIVVVQRMLLGDQRRFVTHGGKGFTAEDESSVMSVLIILTFSFFAVILPLAALILVSLSRFWSGHIDTRRWSLSNYRQIFHDGGVTTAIYNSVSLSLAAVVLCIPLGYLVASIIVRGTRFPILRAIIELVVGLPLAVPAVLFGAGFLLNYTRPPFVLYGTRIVVILVYVTLMLPFATRILVSALVSLGQQYVEAARVSGSGELVTNLRVLVPLLRSSLGGAAALIFVLLTHEFAASLLVRSTKTQLMGTVLFDYWNDGIFPVVAAIAVVMSGVTAIGVTIAMVLGGRRVLENI